MKVCIVGTGYVGLVSGLCLSLKGHDVSCVDIDSRIVEKLNSAEPTIHECGLPDLLKSVLLQRRFRATTSLTEALEGSELVLIAVGTPSKDGEIDLAYVRDSTVQVGEYLRHADRYLSVVVKSTVTPGTTDTFVRQHLERSSRKSLGDFGLGMNPEFLREGEAIEDFLNPDRIVLGFEDGRTLSLLENLYEPWGVEKIRVNSRTAELTKYANNALLATQISVMNEIANLSSALGGIDVMDIVHGVSLDSRWNPENNGKRVNPGILKYLIPGCGFGGSCFPKDLEALVAKGKSLGLRMQALSAILDVNAIQPYQVLDNLIREIGSLNAQRVLILGLAFKPGTDDIRESPALKIVAALVAAGAKVSAHDPVAITNFRMALNEDLSGEVRFCDDWLAETSAVDIVVLLTQWDEYKQLERLDLSHCVVFDARRFTSMELVSARSYLSVGYSRKAHEADEEVI